MIQRNDAGKSRDRILDALSSLLGAWDSSGSMKTGDGGTVSVTGTDTYEWLPGRRFMIHRADVVVGDEKVDVVEVIGGFDDDRRACAMHGFHSDGTHSVMWASLNADGSLLFADDTIRATLTVRPGDQTMEAGWERLNDGEWVRWMEMYFAK